VHSTSAILQYGVGWVSVGAVTLPAGNYLLSAKVQYVGNIECSLNFGAFFNTDWGLALGDVGVLNLQGALLNSPGGTIHLLCFNVGPQNTATVYSRVLTALNVGQLSVQ